MMRSTMRYFRTHVVLALLVFLLCSSPMYGDDPTKADDAGFVSIFDGKTLSGWKGDPIYWRVENGCLVGEITPKTLVDRNTFLIWEEAQPKDFELKLEYRITKDGNSGINYRSEKMDDHPYALTGYQADIDGKNRYTGQNYEERGRTTLAYSGQKTVIPKLEKAIGAEGKKKLIKKNAWTPTVVIESLGTKEELTKHIKSQDWNQVHLVVRGNRLQHYVNGVLLSDVTDNDPLHRRVSGYLGVQVHVGPPMKVEYRKLRLKVLKAEEQKTKVIHLLNGKDLSQFYTFIRNSGDSKVAPEKDHDPNGVYRMADGLLRVSGQHMGYLATKQEFKNYRLVAEFKWGAKTWDGKNRGRDAGLFFNATGEDRLFPKSLECQLLEGATGDLCIISGASLTVDGETKNGQRFERPGKGIWKNKLGYRGPDEIEKPLGEWNRIVIENRDGKVTLTVNDRVMHQGTKAKPSSGRILIQSNNAELFYRKLDLYPY